MPAETEDMICRGLFDTVEVRAIDEDARMATFAAATENGVDTFFGREFLRMSGADLKRYRKNPVVLDTHDRFVAGGVIGNAAVTIKGRELLAAVTFAETERAEEAWQLVLTGFLKALSVGFRALEVQALDEGEHSGTGANRIEGPARIVKKWELFEISVVPVPADADALRRSAYYREGGELADQVRVLSDDVKQLLSSKEPEMAKENKPTPGPAEEAENTSERAPASVEPQRPEIPEEVQVRQLKARRESVMACTPESLRGYADELLMKRDLSVDSVLEAVRTKHAEQREAIGTPEPAKIEGAAADTRTHKDVPRVADIDSKTLLRSVCG